MSATDLAILGRKLTEFPEVMQWRARPRPLRGGQFTMRNTNHLVRTYNGATGLKTGYYAAAGFEVTATASRDGLNLDRGGARCADQAGQLDEAGKLLSKGFAGWKAIEPVKAGQPVGAQISVSGGKEKVLRRRGREGRAHGPTARPGGQGQGRGEGPAQVTAPVTKGQVVGEAVDDAGRQGDRPHRRPGTARHRAHALVVGLA